MDVNRLRKQRGDSRCRRSMLVVAPLAAGALAAGCLPAAAQDGTPSRRVELHLGSGLTVGMVELPAGSFRMGSPDEVGYDFEHPVHEVRVEGFLLAEHEVTIEQWALMDGHASPPAKPGMSALRPVDRVSWCEALRFANFLSNELVGAEPVYDVGECEAGAPVAWDRAREGFRLPTEAEWEYAARAGTTSLWSSGDEPAALRELAWFAEWGSPGIREVGSKRANPWGLYDVHGNVWEWTWDAWAPYDGSSEPDERRRVVRGGAAWFVADMARSAFRYPREIDELAPGQGLRLVLDRGVQVGVEP
jgi:formylglycine-generating enzyme required for sulfatase activity